MKVAARSSCFHITLEEEGEKCDTKGECLKNNRKMSHFSTSILVICIISTEISELILDIFSDF